MENVIEIKNYRHIETVDSREKALDSVTFDVHREPMRFVYDGQEHMTERETIFRMEDGKLKILGYASPDYKIVPHRDALDSMFTALDKTGIPYRLSDLSLDRNGAKMFAQFTLDRTYDISPAKGDVLCPILTGINSYDLNNALGFDLESVRLVCLNMARASVKDFSQRFLHTASVDPEKLVHIAAKALDGFENKIIPLYRHLAEQEVSKSLAVKAVAVAVRDGVIPMNVANFAKHCVDSDRAAAEGIKLTAWAMFNAFTWASTKRGAEQSPQRARQIRGDIANLFADGGKDLLKQASLMEDKSLDDIFSKAA